MAEPKKRSYGTVYDALKSISKEDNVDFGIDSYTKEQFRDKYFTGPGNIENLYNKLSKVSDETQLDFGLGTRDEWLASFGYKKTESGKGYQSLAGKPIGTSRPAPAPAPTQQTAAKPQSTAAAKPQQQATHSWQQQAPWGVPGGVPARNNPAGRAAQRQQATGDAISSHAPFRQDLTMAERLEIEDNNNFATQSVERMRQQREQEEQRRNEPLVETGNEGVDTYLTKTQGQWEDELQGGLNEMSQKWIRPNVDAAMDAATEKWFGNMEEASRYPMREGGEVSALRRANESVDPEQMLKDLQANLEATYSNPEMQADIKRQANALGLTKEEYAEQVLKPALEDDLMRTFDERQISQYMPKNDIEYILQGVSNSIGGMIMSAATETKAQRAYKNMAAMQTEEGENPDYTPGTGAKLAQMGISFAADAPFFGFYGRVGGNVAKKLVERQIQKMVAKGMSENAARAVVSSALENSVGARMKNYLMQHVVSSSITMAGYNATSESTRQMRDSEFAPGQILTSTLEGGATGAAFGVTGAVSQALTQPLSGVMKIGGKGLGFLAEAETMYTTEELAKMLHGQEGFTNPFEGSIEAVEKLGVMKVSGGHGITKAIEGVLHPVRSLGRKHVGINFTPEEEAYIRTDGQSLLNALGNMHPERSIHDVNGKKRLTEEGEAKRQELANAYNEFMTNKQVPYTLKMKVQQLFGGLMPDAAHTPLETGADIIHNADGSVILKTRDKDGNCMQDIKFNSFSEAEEWRDAHINEFRLNDAVNMWNGASMESRATAIERVMAEHSLDEEGAMAMIKATLNGSTGADFTNGDFLSVYDAVKESVYPDDAPHVQRSYEDGRQVTPEERHRALADADIAERTLAYMGQSFADEVIGAWDNPDAKIQELAGRNDITGDQVQAAIDYYNKRAKAEGMMDETIKSVDDRVTAANAEVDRNTNQDNGTLIQVESYGKKYYITSGEVHIDDDGRISPQGSGKTLVARDIETGELRMLSPDRQIVVTSLEDPAMVKSANDSMEGLRGQLMDEADLSINYAEGTPAQPVDGDVFTGADGNQYMAVAAADGSWMKIRLDEKGDPIEERPVALDINEYRQAKSNEIEAAEAPDQQAAVETAAPEAAPEAQVEKAATPAAEVPASMEIPTDEEGRLLYEQAAPEATRADLVGKYGEEKAQRMITTMAANTRAAFEAVSNEDTSKMTDMAELAEHEDRVAEAERKMQYWESMTKAPEAAEKPAGTKVEEKTEDAGQPAWEANVATEREQFITANPLTEAEINASDAPDIEKDYAKEYLNGQTDTPTARQSYENIILRREEAARKAAEEQKKAEQQKAAEEQAKAEAKRLADEQKQKDAELKVAKTAAKKAVGKTYESVAEDGSRYVMTVKGVSKSGKTVYVDEQVIGKDGQVIRSAEDKEYGVERIGRGLTDGTMQRVATTAEKLSKAYRNSKQHERLVNVLDDKEQQELLATHEKVQQLRDAMAEDSKAFVKELMAKYKGKNFSDMSIREAFNDEMDQHAREWEEKNHLNDAIDAENRMLSRLADKHMEELFAAESEERAHAIGSNHGMKRFEKARQVYAGTEGADIFLDETPRTVREFVSQNMPKNISWEDVEVNGRTQRGLASELGLREKRGIGKGKSTNAFNSYLAKSGEGISAEEAVHRMYDAGDGRWNDQDIRNAMNELFLEAEKPSDISDAWVNDRIADAEGYISGAEQQMLEEYEAAMSANGGMRYQKTAGKNNVERVRALYDRRRKELQKQLLDAQWALIREQASLDAAERMPKEENGLFPEVEAVLTEDNKARILKPLQEAVDYYTRLNETNERERLKVLREAADADRRQTELSFGEEREQKVERERAAFIQAADDLGSKEISIDDDALREEFGLKHVVLSKNGNHVTLTHFISADPGKGNGTRFMEALARTADERGWILALTPDNITGLTSVKRLKDFYKRFGFKDNKGRNTDFETRESMVRKPNKAVTEATAKKVIAEVLDDIMQKAGIEVETDREEGQRVLDEYNSRNIQDTEENVKFHKVEDEAELQELENGKTVKRYRAMQLIDGKLYPPMSAKVDGQMRQPTEIGVWEKSEERPDLAKNGKFNLNKGQKGQSPVPAAYNPYFHTSTSGLNDQFTSAYKRPELVVVEVEIPESELYSGYKAEGAKDAVGNVGWHSGPVNTQLPADRQRQVTLSRYSKVVRIVPDSEVADMITKQLEGTNIEVPYNVVTPALRLELQQRGVKISEKASGTVTEDINGNPIKKQKVSQPIFVSNAMKAVEGITQEKATPEQWLKMIEKGGGLKAAEDKWTGLSDWLKGQDKKSLTKQEVMDYIRENQVQIEEVNYAEFNEQNFQKLEDFNDEFRGFIEAEKDTKEGQEYPGAYVDRAFDKMVRKYGEEFDSAFDYYKNGSGWELMPRMNWSDEISNAAKRFLGAQNTINSTRLNRTTKGLENKKEIALTIPNIEPWNEHDEVHFGDAGEGRAIAWVRFGETTIPRKDPSAQKRFDDAEKAWDDFGGKMYDKYGASFSYHLNEAEQKEYRRLAEEANNARLALRDANAPIRVLVIDEIQSKRHQEGREKGYKDPQAYKEWVAYREELSKKYPQGWNPSVMTKEEYEHLEELRSKAFDNKNIPAAPFEKNWHELAVKRMLRYAAENGYDKIAWTTGEQQAERYNIGGVVNSIKTYQDAFSDNVKVEINTKGSQGWTFWVDKEGKITSRGASAQNNPNLVGKHISDFFGKEVAVKIMSGGNQTIDGEDLRVGGEGMKGFYDKMLPNFMNKYGKKWGVKVGEVELPKVEEAGRSMWSVDVTPEMKESVMQGQPMFFKTADGQAYGFTKDGKLYFDPAIANDETRVHEYTHLWAEMKRRTSPREWEDIKRTILNDKATQPFIALVRRDYPELRSASREDDFVEEVLTQFSGRQGAEKLRQAAQQIAKEKGGVFGQAEAVAAVERVKQALEKFWRGVAEMFGWKFTTAEEVADRVLYDMLSGMNPNEVKAKEEQPIYSENFKNYFGDWENDPEHASKVVDSEGKPLVLYHGTNLSQVNKHKKFYVFYEDSHFGTIGQARDVMGQTKRNMDFYIKNGLPMKRQRNEVYPVYLNIRNPKRVTDVPFDEDVWDGSQREWWDKQVALAKKQGYDGLVYRNEYEDRDHPADSWIAFYPEQVKSATENIGTYDPTNPDIRYQKAGAERKTAWWQHEGRPKGLNPADWRSYATDEAKEYFANFKSEDGRTDFTKWSHPNLAYITAAAWDGAVIPVEELMRIPEFVEAERRVQEKRMDREKFPKFRIPKTERRELRERLLDAEHGSAVFENGKIKKVNDKEDFSGHVRQEKKAFIVVGRPAGGKSSVFANRLSYENGARIVDSDTVKPWLSGYDDGYGAGYVQDASADVASSALKKASDAGDNIVMPRIGGSSVMKEVMMLREKGYDVQIFYNEVSEETSIMRAASRFAQEGRYLSLDYLTTIKDKDSNVFRNFATAKLSDYYESVNGERSANENVPLDDVLAGRGDRSGRQGESDGRGDLRGRGSEDVPGVGGEGLPEGNNGSERGGEAVPDGERIFSYAEWKSNDVAFGEKPREIWNSNDQQSLAEVLNNRAASKETTNNTKSIELNVATARDKASRDYMREVMASKGLSEQESDHIMGIIDDVSNQVMSIAEKYPAFKRWQETGIVDKVDKDAYDAMWRIMDEKLGWIPNRSAFKKNGEYPLNIDLGALCTKREAMDALVQIIADQGGAQNLGPTQIEALKDLLKDEGFLTACDICFVETKRARAINDANRFAYEWQSVLEGLGITDDVEAGKRESLTDEQMKRLAAMTGKDYKKAYSKYIPKERMRTKQGKTDLDTGITPDKMKMIAGLMVEDASLAGRFRPEWLMTTKGTDWLFRTYGTHTRMGSVLAAMFGAATAKPLEGFNIYDPLSWRKDFDAKKFNEEGIYAIGGFRAQSFTDFNPILFYDYVQMFSDLAIRRLPMHIYTKVPSLIKLFGETGSMFNMSLVPEMVKGVDPEHAGLKPDGKGGWDYAWADESFPVDEAMELRRRPEFGGRVGTIAVGVSDEHIRKMLDDENIDMIIPYHKSGMPRAVQVKTGLENATDYTDYQNTQGAPSSAHFNYNAELQRIGDPRKTAQAYLDWCDKNGYTPKFPQFRDHKNYYKLLEDFRGYDGEGKPVVQGPVRLKLTENWQGELETALTDRGDVDRRISEMQQNTSLMDKAKKILQYQRMDGEVRNVMMKRLSDVLGNGNVQSLRQEEFFDALETAYSETMGDAEAHSKVEVLRSSDGRVYGFSQNGKVVFNENLFNANTPAHEFTHVWVKVARSENPKVWSKGLEMLKQTQEWKDVIGDELYKDIQGDEDAIGSEVLARIVGRMNEDFIRQMLDPTQKQMKDKKLYEKIYDWLKDFFKGVRSIFGTTRRELTFDEFIRMPLKDLWDETTTKRFKDAVERLHNEDADNMVDTDVEMQRASRRPKVQSHMELDLFGNELRKPVEGSLEFDKEHPAVEQEPIVVKGKEVDLKKMSDDELLQSIGSNEGRDRDFFLDEYDQRHRKEYGEAVDSYIEMLERENVSLDDAYGMYGDVVRQWKAGGFRSSERSKLMGQIDALEDYVEQKEAERIEREEREEEERFRREEEAEAAALRQQQTEQARQYEQQKTEVRAHGYDLTKLKMRDLGEGESCHVERRYTENNWFSFTGGERVESSADVAYIFRELENAGVENSFMVLVKDGVPTVVHLGIGNYASTVAPLEQAFVAAQAVNPDKVWFLHNHPSGNLHASRDDINLYNKLKGIFGRKAQPGIIIDTKSGKYGEFTGGMSEERERPTSVEGDEIPVKVFNFSKQVFDKDWNPETAAKAIYPSDIAAFVSSHRLGEHRKMSLLVLDQAGHITGNIFLPWTTLEEASKKKNAAQIATQVNQMGGVMCVIYGSYNADGNNKQQAIRYMDTALKAHNVRLRDVLTIGESAFEKGLIGESESEYATMEAHDDSEAVRQYEDALAKWKARNGLPADATAPRSVDKPVHTPGEDLIEHARRLAEFRRKEAIWKTAPKLSDFENRRRERQLVEDAIREAQRFPESQGARMNAVEQELIRLRHAVSRQRAYDKTTVKAVTDFAQEFMKNGWSDNLSRGEMERILSAVKNATGKRSVKKEVDNILDILIDNHLRNLDNAVKKMASIKELKQTAQGVETQGKLELKGQRMIKEFRNCIGTNMDAESLRQRQQDLMDKMSRDPEGYDQEYEGVSLALQYVEDIKGSQKEWEDLKRQRADAIRDYGSSGRSYDAQQQLLESLTQAMQENKMERIRAYNNFMGRLAGNIDESVEGAREFVKRDQERMRRIWSMANQDLAGKDMGAFRVNEEGEAAPKGKAANFFLLPMATFEQMLKQFGSRNAYGQGRLYDHFMRGWVEAINKGYTNVKAAKDELDAKAREVFGKKVKRWSDLYKIVRDLDGMDVSITDAGETKTIRLTQGNLLYVYMADKMVDGKMKLRNMGITDEDIEAIKDFLDPRLVTLGDWLQDEYLPRRRVEYNKVHERMFGAPMATIENYFPIKILGDARYQEEDIAAGMRQNVLPSTITGSIIKRTKNLLALDILHTDALSLAIEHIEDMEKWAAQAEWNKDINTLLSYSTFRNKVKNMKTIYGSGDKLWEAFYNAATLAAGEYRPKVGEGSVDKAVSNIAKGVTAAKISFRAYTAFKQILSAPAFLHDVDIDKFAKYSVNPYGSWKWAMENMPIFKKRWESRQAGDTRLMDDPTDWKMWKTNFVQMASRLGMSPNAFVDGVTCAVGARAIYESRLKKYINMGASEAIARRRALQDAEIGYNLTQQSSEGAFVSAMQKDRTVLANMLTVFRNSPMSYSRQWVDASRNLKHRMQKGYREDSIGFMKKQLMDELGLDEAQAQKAAEQEYNRAGRHEVARMLNMMFGVTIAWNLGASLPYLLIGDDDETKKEMLTDAALKGFAGPIEGFSAGSIVSDLVGLATSEGVRNVYKNEGGWAAMKEGMNQMGDYDINPLPLMADLERMIGKMKYDGFAAAQDVFNICVQSGIGVNPQTFTDMWNACMDYGAPAWDGTSYTFDPKNMAHAKEIALFIMRMMNAPTSSWRNKYIDELGMSANEAKKLPYDELAKRYAHYKHWKDVPVTGFFRSKESRDEKMGKIRQQFDKAVQERMARLDAEELQSNLERSKDPDERRMIAKIIHERIMGSGQDAKKPNTEWQRQYQKWMTYEDIHDSELLSKRKIDAKADNDKETLKTIAAAEKKVTALKKKLVKGEESGEELMERIRQIRKDAIDKTNKDK